MNKYGGIADISCDKRIYNLWYQMLRRCYDAEQGYCLNKDTKIAGNKVYSRETCCFIPIEENIRDISRRNPNITKAANESHKVKYALFKDEEVLIFDSEKEACKYLGVVNRCKGYRIAKMDGGEKKNE